MIEVADIVKSYGSNRNKNQVYCLLKIVMSFVFADIKNMPEYNFDFKALVITLTAFVITYELIMYLYSLRIKKLSVKSVMLE